MNNLPRITSVFGLLALTGGIYAAPMQSATKNVVVVTEVDEDGQANSRSVQMTIVDGEMSVKVDGVPLPESRLRREDGRIVILDEAGNEIESIQIGVSPHPFDMQDIQVMVGDGDNIFWHADQMPDAAPLPVMLGIHLDRPGPALERHLGLEPGQTTMISGLYEGLAADRSGLQEFDVIVAIDGQTPSDPLALRGVLAEKTPGQVVQLTVIQRGQRKTVSVTLEAYDRESLSTSKMIGQTGRVGQREMLMLPDHVLRDGGGGLFEFKLPDGRRLLETMPRLDDIFVDDNNQLFERSIRIRPLPSEPSMGDASAEDQVDVLEERIRRLERMLREVLEDTP